VIANNIYWSPLPGLDIFKKPALTVVTGTCSHPFLRILSCLTLIQLTTTCLVLSDKHHIRVFHCRFVAPLTKL
jgi:hypothetical protein